jgi:hypothetical protein
VPVGLSTELARVSFIFTGRGGICLIISGTSFTLQQEENPVVTLLQVDLISTNHGEAASSCQQNTNIVCTMIQHSV